MEIVGDGDVNDVDRWVGEEFVVVGDAEVAVGNLLEPGKRGGVQVGDAFEDRPDGHVFKRAPAGERAGDFAAHQAASDDADVDGFHGGF